MLATFRHSIRLLLKSPAATLAAVTSLALGIGANTTIFALLDAVVLRPLPVWRSDRLVEVTEARYLTVSYPAFLDLAERSRTLSGLAAFAPRTGSVTVGRNASVGDIQVVSGNYFDVLGVGAAVGRALNDSDDRATAEATLVLSHAFWSRSFGADPAVVGRPILVNGSSFLVIGVAPPGFKGATLGADPLGWIPLSAWPRMATGPYLRMDMKSRNWGWLRMVGRLRDGIELGEARAELSGLAAAEQRAFPTGPDAFELAATPLRSAATGMRTRSELTRFVSLLSGMVLAVLGVACANVSGLLLARAMARRREIAVRVALGASRSRIVRELVTDSVLLATIGGGFGLLTSMWTIELLNNVRLPGGIDMSQVDVAVGAPAVAVTAGIALVAVLLFGLAPAVQTARLDVIGSLRDQPVDGPLRRHAMRGALVAIQVTFSLVLLVGSALFARTLQTTLSGELGFDPRGVSYAATNVSLQRYSAERALVFYDEALHRLRSSPGVRSAAWTRLIPSGNRDVETASVPGYVPPDGRTPTVGVNVVSSGYFETMGIRILRGRAFTDADTIRTTPVVVVSEAADRRFWNGQALGRRFTIQNVDVTVVGVARDVPPEPGAAPEPFVYVNVMQHPAAALGAWHLMARSSAEDVPIVAILVEAIRASGPVVPILESRTMDQQLLDLLGPQRSAAALLGLLSAIALVLSAGGIYAMVWYWVSQRTHEFGVRMALGASASSIRRLALRHAAAAVLVGVLLGLPIAAALGRASRALLFDLSPMDPIAFVYGVATILVVALLASLIPAHRAATINPLESLRQ
jgi:predicted permease